MPSLKTPRAPKPPRSPAPPPERLGAVVLARAESGEADLIVTFLTRERGLLTALAKNARKSVRRFGGGLLSPGAAAWYDFRVRPNRDLAFVERGELNPKAPKLPPDPVVQALAAWALELARAFEAPGNPATESFNLIVRHFAALSADGPRARPFLLERAKSLAFTKLYMELAGFGPDFGRCRSCGRPPEGDGECVLDRREPGVLCPECRGGAEPPPGAFVFPASLALKLSRTKSVSNAPAFDEGELSLAEDFYQALSAYSSGRIFKSWKVLKSYLKESGGNGG